MIQKYEVIKDVDNNKLIIKEYAMLEKEIFSFLYEVGFDIERVRGIKNIDQMIQIIRTHQMFPPDVYSRMIAESILRQLSIEGAQKEEIVIDDIQYLEREEDEEDIEVEVEEDSIDVDDLLEEDFEDDYVDGEQIRNSPLKIAEDDNLDTEE